jgi:ferric-dicitrate binding protein FerR (iron transport regulator)
MRRFFGGLTVMKVRGAIAPCAALAGASSATVRGTIWLTQDPCDGTLTTVKRGRVNVRDFKRRRTVSVKAGHSYLARAARAATKTKGRSK